ncbi:MAG: sugar phosphate isomerase/epimerase family protein [Pseudomonadota bacterium]
MPLKNPIGINLLLWTGSPDEKHLELLPTIKALGYDGVEVPITDMSLPLCRAYSDACDDIGLRRTATALIPDRTVLPYSDQDSVFKAGVEHLETCVDKAAALGAEVLMGPFFQPVGDFSDAPPSEDQRRRCVEAHRAMADRAEASNIQLSVEYLNRFEACLFSSVDEIAAHVEAVDRKNFGATFDTFHANIEESNIISAFTENLVVINHVHISENHRGVPGTGHIPFKDFTRTLSDTNYNGWVVVEMFGKGIPELAAATRIWRPLFADPMTATKDAIDFLKAL